MSCKIDYIEDRFRESNPTLADSLTDTFDAIKVKVLESKLFKPANDGTGRYLFAQESKNITAYNAQKAFVDDVNDSYKGEVIENYNGAVRINVLNLPEAQQALGTYVTPIKEGVPELFESNPELANAVYEALGFNNLRKEYSNIIIDQVWKRLASEGITNADSLIGTRETINNKDFNKFWSAVKDVDIQNVIKFFESEKQKALDSYSKYKGEFDPTTGTFTSNDTSFFDKKIEDLENLLQQKQQAQQLYSQYLDTIFPDSKVKDIVYHGTNSQFDKFDKSFYQSGSYYIYFGKLDTPGFKSLSITIPALINLKNPSTFIDNKTNKLTNEDGFIENYTSKFMETAPEEGEFLNQYGVKEPEQIHILGSKQDVEGFKQYVENVSSTAVMIAGKDAFEIDAMLDEDTRAKLAYLRGTNTLTIEC